MMANNITENLRALRKRAGITQKDATEQLGISLPMLRRWETGETSPTGEWINAIAQLYGVEPQDVMATGNNSMEDSRTDCLIFRNATGIQAKLPATPEGYELFEKILTAHGLLGKQEQEGEDGYGRGCSESTDE